MRGARLGFNYRLSDINCALGVVQMRRLAEINAKRSQVASWYVQRLADERRVTMQRIPPEIGMSWFVFVLRLSNDYTQEQRDNILDALRQRGIGCNNYFTPTHLQPFYQDRFDYKPGDLPITEALSARTNALPFHNGLCEADVDEVVSALSGLL